MLDEGSSDPSPEPAARHWGPPPTRRRSTERNAVTESPVAGPGAEPRARDTEGGAPRDPPRRAGPPPPRAPSGAGRQGVRREEGVLLAYFDRRKDLSWKEFMAPWVRTGPRGRGPLVRPHDGPVRYNPSEVVAPRREEVRGPSCFRGHHFLGGQRTLTPTGTEPAAPQPPTHTPSAIRRVQES